MILYKSFKKYIFINIQNQDFFQDSSWIEDTFTFEQFNASLLNKSIIS